MPVKLVLFDLDGTLYDKSNKTFLNTPIYKEIIGKQINFISKKTGIEFDKATELRKKLITDYNYLLSIGLEKEFNIQRKEYYSNVWNIEPGKYIEKNPELPKTIQLIKIRKAILTNSPLIWANRVLNWLGVSRFFERVYTGDIGARKPQKEAFERAARDFNVNFNEILMIGDELENDILAAKELGIKTICVGNYGEADFCIKSINELPGLLVREGIV